METINSRVKTLRKHLGMTTRRFGEEITYSNATISNVENARPPYDNGVDDRILLRISEHFGVNIDWLRNGVGPMFAPPVVNKTETPAEWAKRIFHLLPEEDQIKIVEIARQIVEESEKKNDSDAGAGDSQLFRRKAG